MLLEIRSIQHSLDNQYRDMILVSPRTFCVQSEAVLEQIKYTIKLAIIHNQTLTGLTHVIC